jgi:hypothetical protein
MRRCPTLWTAPAARQDAEAAYRAMLDLSGEAAARFDA